MNQANENTDNKTYVVIKSTDSYYRNISHRNSNTTFCRAMHHYAWVVESGNIDTCNRYLEKCAGNYSDNVTYIDDVLLKDLDNPEEVDYQGAMYYLNGQPFFKIGDRNLEDDLRYYNIMEIREAYEFYENNYSAGKEFAKVLQYLNIDTGEFYKEEETEETEDNEDNENC